MNLIRKCIVMIFFILGSISHTLSAQKRDTTSITLNDPSLSVSNLTPDDYAKLVLPPLSFLLETATNNPKIGSLLAMRKQEEGNLKTVKRNWLNNLYVFGNYQYGQYAALLNNTAQNIPIFTSQAQSIYSTGAGVNLPLEIFYNRKNKIKIQQSRLEQINCEISDAVNELKMRIAEIYSTAILKLAVVKVNAEIYTLANSEMKMSEIKYMNGDIALSQFSVIKSQQAAALTGYETTRSELNNAILFLELMTGVSIIKK